MDILVIDDDPSSVFLARLLLTREALFDTITSFQNPEEALSFIHKKITSGLLPKVILLDINMPMMDGWTLLEALKPYQAQLQVQNSIFMLTSSTDITDLSRAKEHPLVTDIIIKPLAIKKIHEIYDHVS